MWDQLVHLGYRELFDFYAKRHGQTLPHTCRQATSHDSLLVPPMLQATLQSAYVDNTSCLFDSQDP